MPSCVMRFCTNYSKKVSSSQGITYHSFPSNELRRIQWVDIVRRQRSEDGWQPNSFSRVCSVHFKDEDKYISAKGSTLLKKSALPSRGVSEENAQPGQILDTRTPSDSGSRDQDPPSRVIEQCRFCGEFSKDCVAVSSDMTYLAGNKTTLALNDTSVQLDFNNHSLPKTVCRDCDAKLQEFCDFVNVVKAAQGTLINVEEEKEDFGTGAKLEETTAEFEETTTDVKRAEDKTESLIVKPEYDSQLEDSDDSKDGIVDCITGGETVFVKGSHKRKSDTDTANPKRLKAKEKFDDYLVIHIKEEVVEMDANDGPESSEVSDTRTDVKPSKLELARSGLVFQMAEDGTDGIKSQGYQSDR